MHVRHMLTWTRLCLLTLFMFALVIVTNVPYLLQTNFHQFISEGAIYAVCTKHESMDDTFYMNHSKMNTLNFVLW